MKSAYFGYQDELEERRKSPQDSLLSPGALTALPVTSLPQPALLPA